MFSTSWMGRGEGIAIILHLSIFVFSSTNYPLASTTNIPEEEVVHLARFLLSSNKLLEAPGFV